MRHLLPLPALVLSTLALAACATAGLRLTPEAMRGQTLAASRCASCHAIGADAGQSPNPASPPFELVANSEGLTRDTLNSYLRDAHNYPAAMQFTLDERATHDLVEYILTLRRPGYHPPI